MNNKEIGTEFEQRMCDYFNRKGYWVHFITPDRRGAQPFDIIAVKDNHPIAIECKTLSLSQKYFHISRLEENQKLALEKWILCGNNEAYVVVEYGDKVYWIAFSYLLEKQKIKMEDLMDGISMRI